MFIGLVNYLDSKDICDSLNAISQSIARRDGWSDQLGKQYAVTHTDAYCGMLPPDESILYIMFLDFAPNCIASETLVMVYDNADEDGGQKTLKIQEQRVQTILGAHHCLVIIFNENKYFDVALPILVQITEFFFAPCTPYL